MIEVLKNQEQINEARKKLNQMGADSSTGFARKMYQLLFFLRFRRKAENVAINKSWDVLKILETIEKYKPDHSSMIYDMGSYNCEIPLSLWWRGYKKIFAADLNPLARSIRWYCNSIEFRRENFYQSSMPKHSLDIITALSVIEHGYDQVNFFKVCHDLLKPGGLVLITTDFNKTKINIDPNFKIFHLSYLIFSSNDISKLVEEASQNGFELLSTERENNWDESENPIHFLEYKMSFIFLGFRKK